MEPAASAPGSFPSSRLRRLQGLELGIWDLFGIWDLVFGIFRSPHHPLEFLLFAFRLSPCPRFHELPPRRPADRRFAFRNRRTGSMVLGRVLGTSTTGQPS